MAPVSGSENNSSLNKKPPRHSLAPKPSTPSTPRAHPPTKQTLLPATPSNASNKVQASTTATERDAVLDADAEKEYQRKLAEKRRQAREAAAAKAKAAAEKKEQEEKERQEERLKMAAAIDIMARSAPPDIIAQALDGDTTSTSSKSSASPQPPAVSTEENQAPHTISPELSEPNQEGVTITPTLVARDTTVVVANPAVVISGEEISTTLHTDQTDGQQIGNIQDTNSSIGTMSESSPAAMSPPVQSKEAIEESINSAEEVRKEEQSSKMPGRKNSSDITAVRERLSSQTGSQSNLMTTSLNSALTNGANSPMVKSVPPIVDDWAKRQEEERAERKKRLDAIMSRVKPSTATTPQSTNGSSSVQPVGSQLSEQSNSEQSAVPTSKSTPAASDPSTPSTLTPVPSTDVLLSKIKSEKVQSSLANRFVLLKFYIEYVQCTLL